MKIKKIKTIISVFFIKKLSINTNYIFLFISNYLVDHNIFKYSTLIEFKRNYFKRKRIYEIIKHDLEDFLFLNALIEESFTAFENFSKE